MPVTQVEVREAELIRLALAGDERAFACLIEAPQHAVYAYIRRMVHEDAIAEELTQEVLLKAFRHLGRFAGQSTFLTWLFRIAINHVRDYLETRSARGRRKEVSLDGDSLGTYQPLSSLPAPDEAVRQRELAAFFDRCLRAIEAHLREAFILRYQEGLGYPQIAAILQISEANARTRVHRAREQILGELRARGYGE